MLSDVSVYSLVSIHSKPLLISMTTLKLQTITAKCGQRASPNLVLLQTDIAAQFMICITVDILCQHELFQFELLAMSNLMPST